MTKFSKDWSKTKKTIEKEVKGNKEHKKFVDGLFKKFNKGLTPAIKNAQSAKTFCDKYGKTHECSDIADQYLKIVNGEKNWPAELDKAKDKLTSELQELISEAEEQKSYYESTAEKNRGKNFLDPKVWAQVKPSSGAEKVDKAISKWNKSTKGNHAALIQKAIQKDVNLAIKLCGMLRDVANEVSQAATQAYRTLEKQNKAAAIVMEHVARSADTYKSNLDEIKDGALVHGKGVAARDEKADKLELPSHLADVPLQT